MVIFSDFIWSVCFLIILPTQNLTCLEIYLFSSLGSQEKVKDVPTTSHLKPLNKVVNLKFDCLYLSWYGTIITTFKIIRNCVYSCLKWHPILTWFFSHQNMLQNALLLFGCALFFIWSLQARYRATIQCTAYHHTVHFLLTLRLILMCC